MESLTELLNLAPLVLADIRWQVLDLLISLTLAHEVVHL